MTSLLLQRTLKESSSRSVCIFDLRRMYVHLECVIAFDFANKATSSQVPSRNSGVFEPSQQPPARLHILCLPPLPPLPSPASSVPFPSVSPLPSPAPSPVPRCLSPLPLPPLNSPPPLLSLPPRPSPLTPPHLSASFLGLPPLRVSRSVLTSRRALSQH